MHPLLLPLAGIVLGATALGVALRPPPPHPERDLGHEFACRHDEIADRRHDQDHRPSGPEPEHHPAPGDRRDGPPGGRPPGPESLQAALIEDAGLDSGQATQVVRLMTTERDNMRAARDTLHAEFTDALAKVLNPDEVHQVLSLLERHRPPRPEDREPPRPERRAPPPPDEREPPPRAP